MKKFFTMTMLLIAIATLSFDVNAQSISEAVCKNDEIRMSQVILMYRQNSIPIDTARDHWSSEDNVDLRIFLKKLTEEIYKNPEAGKQYLASGKFFEKCVQIHRGY